MLALLLVVTVAGTYVLQKGDSAIMVDTVSVARGNIDSRLQLTGKVINDRTVILTALLDGEIMAIRAREGDVVKAGSVLAELDSRQAKALLDKASAELVLQQQAVDASSRNYERTKLLFREENASEQALDDSLDARLAAEASLQAAQATLTLNQLRLDNALIRSPYDGTVIQQSAETGQWLEAGQALFTVVATEGMVIETPVNATDWPRLSVGQKVELTSEVNSDIHWSSMLDWIAPTVTDDDTEGKVVAVRFPPGEGAPALLLGQEVDVDLSLEQVEDVLVVPFQALQEETSGEFIAFVLQGDRAEQRNVSIGLSSLSEAEVVDGLIEGDEVIIPGGQQLHDGLVVSPRR
ncbi:efflux RND transporter periplasmic adaptor subunit [Granulosicoccus antarcticus]|uniref:Efflux pump periplasmic linker BepF n=1 Tax=Granulosicoccus antarcticus IMCC3135 TaxID=1192854 RepID=A0A2Z2P8M7_9GAMM|nr:efflux RND transporter periplasmic adaptor subunit [Granulosicoccus antarcticus]ASJ76234.1 Efflux pump periplasmic linker BepF [Granulosicoccus antarcticus IMCC3135]